ncbi:MAG: replication-relaxation family protein [Candidatus Zixiibacteriota bacterium]
MSDKAFKMTDRDYLILQTLYEYRYLSISQIELLFFPSLQTAYRRMKILRDQKLIDTIPVPEIHESIFFVTKKGFDNVVDLIKTEGESIDWRNINTKPKNSLFMNHFLAINDFRINLSKACNDSDINLVKFIPEYYGGKSNKGSPTKYIRDTVSDFQAQHKRTSHTPDGVFALERDGKFALFFLEIDMGTEVVSNIKRGVLKAIWFYVNYLIQGGYQHYCEDFSIESFKGFRSLFVTTSESRIENIRQASDAIQISQKAKQFQWITTFESVENNGVFDPVWKSIDHTDSNSYQIG